VAGQPMAGEILKPVRRRAARKTATEPVAAPPKRRLVRRKKVEPAEE